MSDTITRTFTRRETVYREITVTIEQVVDGEDAEVEEIKAWEDPWDLGHEVSSNEVILDVDDDGEWKEED